MKKLLATVALVTVVATVPITLYARNTQATTPTTQATYITQEGTPLGHHVIFFEDSILERHRDIFESTFITDTDHMDWLVEEYNRLFDNDWEAWDALKLVVVENFELISEVDIEVLLSMPTLELRDYMMEILYAIDVYELGLDDFVGGLRWSVYNMDLELTTEELMTRLVYVMGLDNMIHLLP